MPRIRNSITLSLLPNSSKRPFVLGPDVRAGFATAKKLGFDAIEIFPPDLAALDNCDLKLLTTEFQIPVSTIGTGGGAISQGLTLTDNNPAQRTKAAQYVREVIGRAAELNAVAIIGSMQGKVGERPVPEVVSMLTEKLSELADYAQELGQALFFEPLNRYESDLVNTLEDAVKLIAATKAPNLKLLADTFHMNIEESDIASAIKKHIAWIGHVHFVDSNRQVAGRGHSNLKAVYSALLDCKFDGFLAVEAFPLPESESAALDAINYFRNLEK